MQGRKSSLSLSQASVKRKFKVAQLIHIINKNNIPEYDYRRNTAVNLDFLTCFLFFNVTVHIFTSILQKDFKHIPLKVYFFI